MGKKAGGAVLDREEKQAELTSKLEFHDFGGPIKLGRLITASVILEVTEVKAVFDSETGTLVRKHALKVNNLKAIGE